MLLAGSSIDWQTIILSLGGALILAIPSIIAALKGRDIQQKIRTPSGQPIGEQVEAAHVTAIINHKILKKQNGGVDEEPPTTA